jgi:tetrahydromethanopterin S-methyltransferase subunit B
LRKQTDEVSQILADELQSMLLQMEKYEERLTELEKIVDELQRQPQSSAAEPEGDDSEEALLEVIQAILSKQ